jgi:hypothetical protein
MVEQSCLPYDFQEAEREKKKEEEVKGKVYIPKACPH